MTCFKQLFVIFETKIELFIFVPQPSEYVETNTLRQMNLQRINL